MLSVSVPPVLLLLTVRLPGALASFEIMPSMVAELPARSTVPLRLVTVKFVLLVMLVPSNTNVPPLNRGFSVEPSVAANSDDPTMSWLEV